MCRTPEKASFRNEQSAWSSAASAIERGFRDLKVYKCEGHIHLTSAPVQLHDFWWKEPEHQPRRVREWFEQRKEITEWWVETLNSRRLK